MMKLTLVLLVALFGVAMSAKNEQVVELGYKSSQIEISDGGMGYFEIPVTATDYAGCVGSNCYVEIMYNKHTAGEQDVCISATKESDCLDTDAAFAGLIAADSSVVTYCVDLAELGNPDTIWVSILGKCKFDSGSFPCYSSTDVDIAGVRMLESAENKANNNCPTNSTYTPFTMDTDGGNTAFYVVDAPYDLVGDEGFTNNPSMMVTQATTDDFYMVLDIDELIDSEYAVEFHITSGTCCDQSIFCQALQTVTPCMWNYTASESYIVYPEAQDPLDPKTGSYKTGPIALPMGVYYVTPYVYPIGTTGLDLDFRFCAGLGFECSAGIANVPSFALMATLVAFVANYLN